MTLRRAMCNIDLAKSRCSQTDLPKMIGQKYYKPMKPRLYPSAVLEQDHDRH